MAIGLYVSVNMAWVIHCVMGVSCLFQQYICNIMKITDLPQTHANFMY